LAALGRLRARGNHFPAPKRSWAVKPDSKKESGCTLNYGGSKMAPVDRRQRAKWPDESRSAAEWGQSDFLGRAFRGNAASRMQPPLLRQCWCDHYRLRVA